MLMVSMTFNMSPGMHRFLERYQQDHDKEIRDMCGELDRHAMLRYIILKYGPILDLHIYKETMGDEVDIYPQELQIPIHKEMTTEEKGLLFIKLARNLGIDLKTEIDWRIPRPGEKPVYVVSCQGRKLYTIGRNEKDVKMFEYDIKESDIHQLEDNVPDIPQLEDNMPRLTGDTATHDISRLDFLKFSKYGDVRTIKIIKILSFITKLNNEKEVCIKVSLEEDDDRFFYIRIPIKTTSSMLHELRKSGICTENEDFTCIVGHYFSIKYNDSGIYDVSFIR